MIIIDKYKVVVNSLQELKNVLEEYNDLQLHIFNE